MKATEVLKVREVYDDERPETALAFIDAIIAVCREHGLSLAHQDHEGAFVIEALDEHNLDWLRGASVLVLR